MQKTLILGAGFIGTRFHELMPGSEICADKIKNQKDADTIISKYKPDAVINCMGATGKTSVDKCEEDHEATLSGNIMLPFYIATACKKNKAFMVHLGSGCIYEGYNDGKLYSETDYPNFAASIYSATKHGGEAVLNYFDNVVQLRLRMPIDDIPHPRNLLTKLIKYAQAGNRILNAPNSITYLPELVQTAKTLIDKKITGVFNTVNKGLITHDEILKEYQKTSGQKLTYTLCTPEELDKITPARRSNCGISPAKLEKLGIKITDVQPIIKKCIQKYVENERRTT